MKKNNLGIILIYSLPFLVGGVLIYSYLRRRKKLREAKPDSQNSNSGQISDSFSNFRTEYFVNTSSGNLNVREKPSATSQIVGSLARGSKVFGRPSNITGWIEVSRNGSTSLGFASSQFLSNQKPSLSTGTFAPPSTSGFENVGRPTGVSQPVIPRADTTSGVSGVGRPSGSSFNKYKVVVSAGSNLNIRKSANTTSQILEKAARGSILMARPSSVANWMEVSKDGLNVYGYASKNYLSLV